jgi:hypothetical protein
VDSREADDVAKIELIYSTTSSINRARPGVRNARRVHNSGDISLVVLLQTDAPVGHRNRLHSFPNFAVEVDLATILVTAKNVDPRIGGILNSTVS